MRRPIPETEPSPEERRKPQYEILSSQEVRDRLFARMNELMEQIRERKVDSLVFLDRSARPLSWLFRDLWERRHSDEPRPDISFLNIGSPHPGTGGGVARRLTNPGDREPWFLSDDLLRLMREHPLDEWLTVDAIPSHWQQMIAKDDASSEELIRAFGDKFDDKNVLVVDDFTATGRSQLAAIGALSIAFPKGTFRSTGFYKVTGEGIPADRQQLPWLQVPGMSGVMELTDDSLFASRIDQENIDALNAAIAESWSTEPHPSADEALARARALREEIRAIAEEPR